MRKNRMVDIEILKAKLKVAQAIRSNKVRLYKYGLTSDDVYNLCNFEKLPADIQQQIQADLTIQNLSAGAFGKTDLVTYKGKQYVRKTQNMEIDPVMRARFLLPDGFIPFLNEIDMLATFSTHPVLYKYVPVYYGFSMSGDKGVYLMEYLSGTTFDNLCKKRGLTVNEWDTITDDIDTILKELHKAGYVHNDSHEENYYILMNGRNIASTIIIDFGLTKPIDIIKQKEYDEQRKIYRNTPAPYNVPAFNFEQVNDMKRILLNRIGIYGKCIKTTVNENFSIPFKERDFNAGNVLTEEQQKEIDALDKEINDLNFEIARQTQVKASLPNLPHARTTVQAAQTRKGIMNIMKGLFERKGGKRRNKHKTHKRRKPQSK